MGYIGNKPTLGVITGADVQDGSLSTADIATGAVTPVKLSTGAPTWDASGNQSYTGTLTGGTGVVNLGSGQFYKDASGNVGIGTASPTLPLDVGPASGTTTNTVVRINGGGTAGYGPQLRFSSAGTINGTIGTDQSILGGTSADLSVYIPTATAFRVYTNATERMRIDSSGNVGIGISTPATKLDIRGTTNTTASTLQIVGNGTSSLLLGQNSSGGVIRGQGGSDALAFWTGGVGDVAAGGSGTERMRITSAGNVGIGTTSPSYQLHSYSNANQSILTYTQNASSGTGAYAGTESVSNTVELPLRAYSSTFNTFAHAGIALAGWAEIFASNISGAGPQGFLIGLDTANPLVFATNNAERMRIDSSGNLLVGQNTTGYVNGSGITLEAYSGANGPGVLRQSHVSGTSSGASFTLYCYNAGAIGSVGQSGTTGVVYNTTSDYRLKNDVTPIEDALSTIEALKPVNFTWIDGRKDDGFLAHELQEVIPNCVTGEKDAVNEDGTPKYQQMDNSGVIPFLVKAIQEQQALITQLQADVASLKGAA